jgi:hypothetical protein
VRLRSSRSFQPFAARSRRPIVAILVTIALVSGVGALLSVRATAGSRHGAAVVEVAARQRTLAERYVQEILLVRSGEVADPAKTVTLLAASAHALLEGGLAPAVNGDDDETLLSRTSDPTTRVELEQEQRLVRDLEATGRALLAGMDVSAVPLTANEHIATHADRAAALRLEPGSSLTRGDERGGGGACLPRAVAVLVRCGAAREPRRLRLERRAQRLPQAARPARGRLLRRLRSGQLHGSRPRGPARDGTRRRAT